MHAKIISIEVKTPESYYGIINTTSALKAIVASLVQLVYATTDREINLKIYNGIIKHNNCADERKYSLELTSMLLYMLQTF